MLVKSSNLTNVKFLGLFNFSILLPSSSYFFAKLSAVFSLELSIKFLTVLRPTVPKSAFNLTTVSSICWTISCNCLILVLSVSIAICFTKSSL